MRENQKLNEKLAQIESHQLNKQWKDHYKSIDKLHQKRTKKMEEYVKT